MATIKPILNFTNDLKQIFIQELIESGYQPDKTASIEKLGMQLSNVRMRNVEARPRRVLESAEFSCPAEHQAGYQALKKKIEAGADINENLSTRLLDADYCDLLLYDWKIHHFHLGQVVDAKGFVQRTGELLFAFITEDCFLSIQVKDHGSFSNQDLVRIIHQNWPEVIEPYRAIGWKFEDQRSDEDIKTLRASGCNTFIEVEPGAIYGVIGGGFSAAGTSMRALMDCDYWVMTARDMEREILENVQEFRARIRREGQLALDPLRFKLHVDKNGFYAVEMQTRVAFLLRPYTKNTAT